MTTPRIALVAAVLIGIGGVAAPTRALSSPQEPSQPRPRSVLFYLVDTCRHDRLSYEGYDRKTTPFLEWLAERSVVFEACYSQAPWTKPSMASMLSSQYPSRLDVTKMEQHLPEDILTWPEHLQANGMHTAGFSANIVMGNLLSNFAQGFDHFAESTLVNRGDPIRFASGSARKLNQHVFTWLDRNDHWPMLLYLHSVDPHEEYEPEPEYLRQFADPARHAQFREEWKKLLGSKPPIPGLYVTQDNFDRTGVDPESFIEHGSNLYDADIRANDDQMKALWDRLQKDGWGEDFIFVFTSDHGEEFFEHGGTSHGYSLYDEMIRVPLMIYAPGLLPGGTRIETPVRSLDIYPTLCELLGLDVPDAVQGESLVPLIRGREEPGGRPVLSEHREDPIVRRMGQGSGILASLRSGRWKLIVNELSSQLIERPHYELYDLDADPREAHNVAEAHPDVIRRLESEMQAIRQAKEAEAEKTSPDMDPDVLEQLRKLGYVGGEEEGAKEDRPDIWNAMESGNPGRVRQRLEQGADPNQRHPELGIRPLARAALDGHLRLAQALLAGGADLDGRNTDGSTALHGAAFLGRVEVLEWLLEKGANPEVRSTIGDTPLVATRVPWQTTEFIVGLLGIEADRAAIEAGRVSCAKLLEAHGRKIDPTKRLFDAIRDGDAPGVDQALAAGARLKDWDPELGWTPLTTAVLLGQEDIARRLLEKGATVHTRNRDMSTTLHGAVVLNDARVLSLLIEHGADVDARDTNGSTPLHVAAFLGREEAARTLLSKGADPKMKDLRDQTPHDVTHTDWAITDAVIRMLALNLSRDDVENGRAAVAKLLSK